MYTRLTNQIMLNATKQNINDNLSRLYDLQQTAASGKKYAKSSDNPAIAAQGLSLRSTLSQIETYQSTQSSTKTWLDTTDEALTEMTGVLTKAQTTVMQALNGTQGADERKTAATTLDGMLQELIDIGNSQDNGRYIFSGLQTSTKPFVLETGTNGKLVDEISTNMSITSNSSGSLIMNGLSISYDSSNSSSIVVDGHTISINAAKLADGTDSANYPTFTVDGTQVIPNPTTAAVINLQGMKISVDYTSGSPIFSVNGTTITNTSNPSNTSIVYSGGSLIADGSTIQPLSGSPNQFSVNGVQISESTIGGSAVLSVNGSQISTSGSADLTFIGNEAVFYSGGSLNANGTTVSSLSGSPNIFSVNGVQISVDVSSGSPAYSITGATFTTVAKPANTSIIYSGGSLLANGTAVSSISGSPNNYLVDGVKISVDTSSGSAVISSNGTVLTTSGSTNMAFSDNAPIFYDGSTLIANGASVSSMSGSPNNYMVNGTEISINNTSGSPVFTTTDTVVSGTGKADLNPPGSIPIIYSGGSLIANNSVVSPISGSPNSYYVGGVLVKVDNTSGSPVYAIDGQTVKFGSSDVVNLTGVTKHNGGIYGTDPNFPVYYHDYIKYQGDSNTISQSIAPSQTMAVSVNGGTAFNSLNGMFDTIIKMRDALNGASYISPQDLNSQGGSVAYQDGTQIDTTTSSLTASTSRKSTNFVTQTPSSDMLESIYGQLQTVYNAVAEQMSINGTKLQNLTAATTRATTASSEIKSQLSQNEDVNMADAASNVTNQTTVYNAVIAISAKVENMVTLWDKI